MEGRPWLRILLVVIAFSLAGLPTWSFTREREIAAPPARPAAPAADALVVRVTFAQPPAAFLLGYLGATLCAGGAPRREFGFDWTVAVPAEGVDLLVKADWPSGTPKTALRVEVTRAGRLLADKTFWAEGGLVETVTVPGAKR